MMKDKRKFWLGIVVFYIIAAAVAGGMYFTGNNAARFQDSEPNGNTMVPEEEYGETLERDDQELFEVSDEPAAGGLVSGDLASEDMASEDSDSEEPVSKDSVLKDSVSEDTVSEDTLSEDTVSEDTVSEGTVSEDTVSEDTVSEDTLSEEQASEEQAAEDTVSDETDMDKAEEEEVKKDEAAHGGKYYTFVVNNPTLSLNVRNKPSRNAAKVGEFVNGTPGYVLQYGSEFSLITNGVVTGYALTKYLVLTEIPEAAFPPAFR